MKKFVTLMLLSLLCFQAYAQDKSSEGEFVFSNESELSLLNSGGNSELETYHAETKNSFAWQKNEVKLEGHYTYGKSNQLLSSRNWHSELRYDRTLSKRFAIFIGEKVEGDEFSGLNVRYNSDLGASYIIHKSDKNTTKVELGYRYTIEESNDAAIGTDHFQKGRAYFETKTQHNKDVFTKFWAEYVPNFSEGSDYSFTFEPSINVRLNSIFALKVAYKGSYDNLPSVRGRDKYDYLYTTSLIAKF